MKRVVVTGMGIWSCIGQDLQTVTENLKQGRSGIIFDPRRIEYGLYSGLVGSVPHPDLKPLLPRKFRATMSEDAEFAYMAARQAFEQARVNDAYLKNEEVGCIFGVDWHNDSVVNHYKTMIVSHDTTMLDPFSLIKEESSSVTMNLATIFHLKGINLSISAACVSASDAIGMANLFIHEGMQDMILVGGTNYLTLEAAATYDAIGGLSINNNNPQHASRPFDKNSDGAVFSNGAAALVLEEYEHAVARGAHILAEIIGFGTATSGASDIAHLETEGITRAIKAALTEAKVTAAEVDYVNAGALSALHEDIQEAKALSHFFSNSNTYISSTESFTGHECAAAGATEMVYSILMMHNDFVAPNINLTQVIEQARNLNIVKSTISAKLNVVLNNSIGGGNAYSAIVLKKL